MLWWLLFMMQVLMQDYCCLMAVLGHSVPQLKMLVIQICNYLRQVRDPPRLLLVFLGTFLPLVVEHSCWIIIFISRIVLLIRILLLPPLLPIVFTHLILPM